MKKYLTALCGAMMLCTAMEAAQDVNLVEKSWENCHHAVYGRAVKTFAIDSNNEQIPINVPSVVTLEKEGPQRNITFDPTTSTFKVKHTGTYEIKCFVKAFSNVGHGHNDQLVIGVEVNDKLVGSRYLEPIQMARDSQDRWVFCGDYSLFMNLRDKDTVRLIVDTTTTDPDDPVYFGNNANNPGKSSLPPDTVASLTVWKPERKVD